MSFAANRLTRVISGCLRKRLPPGSLRARFVSAAWWALVSNSLAQSLSLAGSVITGRLLGLSLFGRFAAIQTTVLMLTSVAGYGAAVTATKYVSELRRENRVRAANLLGLCLLLGAVNGAVCGLLLFGASRVLATYVFADPALTGLLRVSGLILMLNCIAVTQAGCISGLEAFRSQAAATAAKGLLSFPVAVAATFAWGLPGAVAALLFNATAAVMTNGLALSRACQEAGLKPTYVMNQKDLRAAAAFGTPAFFSSTLVAPMNWAACTLLIRQPEGYGQLALFNAANQWRTVILFLPAIVVQFSLPLLSSVRSERDLRRYRTVLYSALGVTIAATILAGLPVAAGSSLILRMYGPSFAAGAPVLATLAAVCVFHSTNDVLGAAILSQGAAHIGLLFNLCWAGVFAAAALVLIPTHLAWGYSLALLVAYAAHLCWQAVYLSRRITSGKAVLCVEAEPRGAGVSA